MKYSEYVETGFNKKMPASNDCTITLSNGMKIEGVITNIASSTSAEPVYSIGNSNAIYSAKKETVSVITIESRTGGNFI